jgi:hypothetical protein
LVGYTVTVVAGTTRRSMTQAQFAQYQVLIRGDPNCSSTPASFTGRAGTWAPVVMGTAGGNTQPGNRALVGTDPEDHYRFGGGGAPPTNPSDPSTAGAEHLVQAGIHFAGDGPPGTTGAYFDTSCYDNGSIISTLDLLTVTGPGHWSENTSPPCGGSVQQIATVPEFSGLSDADIQGWGCSDHITFPSFPTDWNAEAVPTDTPTKPTCGTDPSTGATACGEAYVLLAGTHVSTTSPDLSLAPAAATNPAGTSHNPGSGTSAVPVSAALSGLTPNTTYHFRVLASNGGGTSNGIDQTFTTLPSPPTSRTPSVSTSAPLVQSSSPGFSGTVIPGGLPTTAHFDYGLDPQYDSAETGGPTEHSTPDVPVGSDFSSHAISAVVSGLVPNAKYHVRLVATNSDGTTVSPDVVFVTRKGPAPGPAVLGKQFVAKPVSGLVLVLLPGHAAPDATGSAVPLAKGLGFIPLTEAQRLPVGTVVDARRGSLQLQAAPSVRHGKLQTGTFTGGLYKINQSRNGLTKGLTTLSLLEGAFRGAPTYASCPKAAGDTRAVAVAALSSRVLQTLRGNAHGRFSTRGRFAAGTVRGTNWAVSDRCDGTLTVVQRGTVAVTDLVRHLTVVVHAGQRYLAAPNSKKPKGKKKH